MQPGDTISVSFARGDGRVWSPSGGGWMVDPPDAKFPLTRCQAAHLRGVYVGAFDVPITADVVAIYSHNRLGNIGFHGAAKPAPAKYLTISLPIG